jgi:hypothetical protein
MEQSKFDKYCANASITFTDMREQVKRFEMIKHATYIIFAFLSIQDTTTGTKNGFKDFC